MDEKDKRVCHKYLVKNNQETCFVDYILTERYYSSIDVARKAYKGDGCFTVIKCLRMSEQTGRLAMRLTEHERRGL